MGVIGKVVKKLRSGVWYPFYNTYCERGKVDAHEILLELEEGTDGAESILMLCRELMMPEYEDFCRVLAVEGKQIGFVERMLKSEGISVERIVKKGSLAYYRHLTTAGFLVNNGEFPPRYVKKAGQRYLYMWDGKETKKNEGNDWYRRGNRQRNLLMADYLIFPDTHTEKSVVERYMLRELYQGVVLDEPFSESDQRAARSARHLCRQFILRERVFAGHRLRKNGRKNIYLYAGDLDRNGITTAFYNMLGNLNKEKYNYFVSFRQNSVKADSRELEKLSKDIPLYPITSEMNLDVVTALAQMCYLKWGVTILGMKRRVEKAYRREWKKHFGMVRFDFVIHYSGYENYMTKLLEQAPCPNAIWMHNDMDKEIAEKKNPSRVFLRSAYESYAYVAPVTEYLREVALRMGAKKENVHVVRNCHDYHRVLRLAKEALAFDRNTISNVSEKQLEKILDSSSVKFVNIGRYSQEKGHERLIAAFHRFRRVRPDSYLIIIGGTGDLYEKMCDMTKRLGEKEHVILIKSMSNPMSVLQRCDCFLLSSFHEGLPMTLYEAGTLGLPVVSADIQGPREFLRQYGGYLVPDEENGLYEGMVAYEAGRVSALQIDFEAYNQQAMEEFQELCN